MILSTSGKKNINLEQIQVDYIAQGNSEKLLLIVPTNRKLRHIKKQIIRSSPDGTAAGVLVETLTTLSEKLLRVSENFSQLSEAAAAVFISQSAEGSDLRYFSRYQSGIPFGTLDRIKSAVSEYKRLGIAPGKLRSIAEKLEHSEQNKAYDIADIYEDFKNRCGQVSAYEVGDVYEKLNSLGLEKIQDNFRSTFPMVDQVIVDGFDEFSTPELDILESVSGVEELELFVNFDFFSGNKSIFGHLDKCYEQFKLRGFHIVEDLSDSGKSFFTNFIASGLFKFSKSKKKIDSNITLFSTTNREREVENIAKLVKLLILKKNARPSQICVAFNNVANYSPLIRSIFPLYGIPINLTDRTKLANSQPVIALINLLEILENDFYFKNILRALSNPFISLEDFDSSTFIRAASQLKITAGLGNWRTKLEANISLIESYGTEGSERKISLAELRSTQKMLDNIVELLAPFSKPLLPGEFFNEMNKLVEKLKIPDSLLKFGGEYQEANIKAFTLFLETVNELTDLTEKENPDLRAPLSHYLEQVKTACGWARFNVKEKSDFGVLVTSVNEIRGLKFDYLLVGGMVDGEFPLQYTPDFFLSGEYRKNEAIRQTEERYHFYQVLSAWRKALFLSYPKVENKHDLTRSFFISELEKLVQVESLPDNFFDEYVYNEKELQLNGSEAQNAAHFGSGFLRAIEADGIRSANVWSESEFNGFIGSSDDETAASLQKFRDREFSISQLETYAKCPFRFFVERVLKIDVDDEPSEEFDSAEIGLILHAILYEFYSKWTDKNLPLTGCSDTVFNSAVESIFKIAEEIFEHSGSDYPLAFLVKEQILGFAGNRKDSILYRFLEKEREADSFRPAYFEAAFGSAANYREVDKISSIEPVEYNGVKLKGKIDRVELSGDRETFSVVDYKLGEGKVTKKNLADGVSLQLPVYLYAAQKLLEKVYGSKYRPESAFIYSLKYSPKVFGKKYINFTSKRSQSAEDKEDASDEQIRKTMDQIEMFVESISEGKFYLTKMEKPETEACKFCDFGSVCRIKELLN